jgi:hypothetical protein
MKKLSLLILVALAATGVAMAQVKGSTVVRGYNTPPVYFGGDVLGAHNGYGRGCVMCHAPHGGAEGNGVSTSDPNNGAAALWGQNLSPYYSQTFIFDGFAVTLPSSPFAGSSGTYIILLCLSCHDGVLSKVSMMKGTTVETLPVVGGNAPTLFGKTPGDTVGNNYVNEHPVGQMANVSCGAPDWWDCTGGGYSTSMIAMNGPASKQFLINYPASFWNGSYPLANFTVTVNGVTCTTCHDQHSMTVWSVGGVNYTTMFFVKGYYDPYTGGNSVAQFCRNCHGGKSNEMKGLMSIPTT